MATENQSGRTGRRRCDQTRSGRMVIIVQIVSWCSVGGLLVMRGVSTLSSDVDYSLVDNTTSSDTGTVNSSRELHFVRSSRDPGGNNGSAETNSTSAAASKRAQKVVLKINPSSAILITVGTTMLVIGPTLLLARILDSRRDGRDGVKFSKVDPPPSYDDVVDKAPRYSSLFIVTESGELVPISSTTPESNNSEPV